MPTLTYVGRAEKVTWRGVEFPKGKPVPLDPDEHAHKHMLEKAKNNPHFETGNGAVSEDASSDDASSLRERLTEMGVTVPGRAGAKWMTDKLKELADA